MGGFIMELATIQQKYPCGSAVDLTQDALDTLDIVDPNPGLGDDRFLVVGHADTNGDHIIDMFYYFSSQYNNHINGDVLGLLVWCQMGSFAIPMDFIASSPST